MSRISFKQFISRQGKKDSRDGTFGGKGGLHSFSNTHPYFQGKLRIPHGGDEDRSEDEDCDPNNEYCHPWQNQGPDDDIGHPGQGSWDEYREWIACVQDPNCNPPEPPDPIDVQTFHRIPELGGQIDVDVDRYISRPQAPIIGPRPRPPGPEGPTDDLWDTRKYRGVTNMNTPQSNRHSLYYTGE